MVNVAIVEDIEEIREEMAALLQLTEDIICVYRFSNAEEALSVLSDDPVDVVMMDINLPGMNGIDCVKLLKQKHPGMQFMMCTIFQDDDNIFDALRVGASGYLLKNEDPDKIIASIREIHSGGSPMNASIARRIIETFHQLPKAVPIEQFLLTKREQELLGLLAKGFRYKEIADQLCIAIETVRKHISNIYTKLQVQSRMEAVNKVFGEKK